MPLIRPLGRELWGDDLPRGRIARVLFCVEQEHMVLLHGFIKKARKTPKRDIDVALKRKKGGRA
jgi:phage-related protein